jgi:hypothetical protein
MKKLMFIVLTIIVMACEKEKINEFNPLVGTNWKIQGKNTTCEFKQDSLKCLTVFASQKVYHKYSYSVTGDKISFYPKFYGSFKYDFVLYTDSLVLTNGNDRILFIH